MLAKQLNYASQNPFRLPKPSHFGRNGKAGRRCLRINEFGQQRWGTFLKARGSRGFERIS